MRGKYFSYDGCEVFPADNDIEDEDQILRLAADVLIDILGNMEKNEV